MRNTSNVGGITVVRVMAALVTVGRHVLLPFGDHLRYDLVFEDENGRFFRVQCKTGWVRNGVLKFATSSVDSRSVKGRTVRKHYRGEIDFFGVYCPQNEKVYLVPVEKVPKIEAFLRLTEPKNNQKSRVRWAREYEIGGVAQLGARLNGIQQVEGSNPFAST